MGRQFDAVPVDYPMGRPDGMKGIAPQGEEVVRPSNNGIPRYDVSEQIGHEPLRVIGRFLGRRLQNLLESVGHQLSLHLTDAALWNGLDNQDPAGYLEMAQSFEKMISERRFIRHRTRLKDHGRRQILSQGRVWHCETDGFRHRLVGEQTGIHFRG